jgi:hypothetical protein
MDDHIILPREEKRRKRKKTKLDPLAYISAILLASLLIALLFYSFNAVVIKIVQKKQAPPLSTINTPRMKIANLD